MTVFSNQCCFSSRFLWQLPVYGKFSVKTRKTKANPNTLATKLNKDIYTVTDILKELQNPGLDIRENLDAPLLKSDILTIDDLRIGMQLEGTVRNVTSFGAFVDIGLHDDGLVHISKMSKNFVNDPKDIVKVGEIVKVYVCDINKEKGKVGLSLIPLE